MPISAPNPYTPDQVPVEVPDLSDVTKVKKTKSTNSAGTFMILGIVVFIAIIIIEAFLLVRTGKLGPQQTPTYAGPTLEK